MRKEEKQKMKKDIKYFVFVIGGLAAVLCLMAFFYFFITMPPY